MRLRLLPTMLQALSSRLFRLRHRVHPVFIACHGDGGDDLGSETTFSALQYRLQCDETATG
jgi:hypothetical protein